MSAARRIAIAVAGLAAIEWIAALFAYRDPLGDAQWHELADAIAARGDEAPVLLATEWLSPSARMHVPAIAERHALLRADLHGLPRFHTVGLDPWSELLQGELEELPAPTLLEQRSIGPFVWATWEQSQAGTTIASILDVPLQVHSDAGSCRGRDRWKCTEGEVADAIVEVDYRPRACLGITVSDGVTVTLRWSAAELGTSLRGHLGFGDYNARLRNDAPADLRVRIDGEEQLRITVSDMEGWRPFAIATTPGHSDIEVEVTAGLSGTWQRKTYDPTPVRTICLEARTIGAAP